MKTNILVSLMSSLAAASMFHKMNHETNRTFQLIYIVNSDTPSIHEALDDENDQPSEDLLSIA